MGEPPVKGAGRLVGKDDVSRLEHAAGNGDTLLLTPREDVDPGPLAALETHRLKRTADLLCLLGAARLGIVHTNQEVVGNGAVGDERVGLEQVVDVIPSHVRGATRVDARRGLPVDSQCAGRGLLEQAEDVQQRRLARARGTHDGHDRRLGERKVEVAEHNARAEVLPQLPCDKRGRLGGTGSGPALGNAGSGDGGGGSGGSHTLLL